MSTTHSSRAALTALLALSKGQVCKLKMENPSSLFSPYQYSLDVRMAMEHRYNAGNSLHPLHCVSTCLQWKSVTITEIPVMITFSTL